MWRPPRSGCGRRSCRSRTSPYGSYRSPQEPHSAAATFDLVRMNGVQEVARQSWSVSMRFSFLPEIPAELVVRNPMGIVISFLQGDRIVTSGEGR